MENNHPIYKSPEWTIYGPYQRKDLRRHVIAYNGIRRITISYPKYLMECNLQRILDSNEEVHHKNGLEFDDNLNNLEVKNEKLHLQEHMTKLAQFFICPTCNITFSLEGIKLSRYHSENKRKPNRKGPYCSRRCSGKQNH